MEEKTSFEEWGQFCRSEKLEARLQHLSAGVCGLGLGVEMRFRDSSCLNILNKTNRQRSCWLKLCGQMGVSEDACSTELLLGAVTTEIFPILRQGGASMNCVPGSSFTS